MRPTENIKQMLKNLNFEADGQVHKRILDEALAAQAKTIAPAQPRAGVWRIIMKSRIMRYTAAAVVMIAAAASVIMMDKVVPVANALEQTMKAFDGLRFVHITLKNGKSEPREFWVKFDEREQVKSFRAYASDDPPSDGPKVFLWNDGKLSVWIKKDNKVITIHDTVRNLELLKLVKKCDPRTIVKELYQLESEGKVMITTSTPISKSQPLIITAKFLRLSNDPGREIVLYADQTTMLVNCATMKDPKEQYTVEFSDYNMAVDANFFTLNEVPRDADTFDLTRLGLKQDELGDNEVAVELARQFVQAIVDKDYKKVNKLCGGMFSDNYYSEQEKFKYRKIIRFEEPTVLDVTQQRMISVPCVAVANYGGGELILRTHILVGPAIRDEPNKTWIVLNGGRNNDKVEIIKDPTDITTTFMRNINAKLASLDINKSTAEDVTKVLGEPWAYRTQGKDLERNDLPEAYTIAYPGGFIINIYKDQVVQWGVQWLPGYVIPGFVLADSIQIGTTLDDVFKKLGPPAKKVDGFGDKSNKIMYEDNLIYANMNSNERKGFCFYTLNSNGEKIRIYLDDDVLYQNLRAAKGLCMYGKISNGKRIRILAKDNKVVSLFEYRTEPIKDIK